MGWGSQKSDAKTEARTWWLQRLFARKTKERRQLSEEAVSLGPIQQMKPSLFRRFAKMMDQIGALRRKETDILDRIAEIEEQHKRLRRAKRLRLAAAYDNDPDAPERDGKSFNFWWTLFLLWLLSRKDKKKPEPGSSPKVN